MVLEPISAEVRVHVLHFRGKRDLLYADTLGAKETYFR